MSALKLFECDLENGKSAADSKNCCKIFDSTLIQTISPSYPSSFLYWLFSKSSEHKISKIKTLGTEQGQALFFSMMNVLAKQKHPECHRVGKIETQSRDLV